MSASLKWFLAFMIGVYIIQWYNLLCALSNDKNSAELQLQSKQQFWFFLLCPGPVWIIFLLLCLLYDTYDYLRDKIRYYKQRYNELD